MYKIRLSKRFKKSYKRCIRRGLDMKCLEEVISILANGEKLPRKYKNHPLHGDYEGCMDATSSRIGYWFGVMQTTNCYCI